MDTRLIAYHVPGPNGGSYRYNESPSIGDVRVARQRGAIILRRVIEVRGTCVCRAWIDDAGKRFVVSYAFGTEGVGPVGEVRSLAVPR